MEFYSNQLFHIYNQGNNRRQIFFTKKHYLYFVWKMRTYLTPFGDIIAWCLMPNHFHWLFYVKETEIQRQRFWKEVDRIEWERRKKKYGIKAVKVNRDHTRILKGDNPLVSLNTAIGILESAYAQAINKEKKWTGSLFKKPCQAKDGWIDEFVTVAGNKKVQDYKFMPGADYAYHCLNYIHDNPTKAKLVSKNEDWIFSSARDYAGMRQGTLCNLELGRELICYI